MKLNKLEDKKILILGFGREGKATFNFLKKHFPEKKIGIADKSDGKKYLDTLKNYDVIIKSPGIPYLPEIKKARKRGKIITSATNIFFDNFKGKIIGITGTKGKSTTTSLIYEILKNGGFDVYLVGNIGHPALDLLDKMNDNSIVVFELSSFQLSDLTLSPHIVVITNIFPEHLDWHGSFEDYKKSKENIIKFQNELDYLIYNENDPEVLRIVQKSKASKIPFSLSRRNEILEGIIEEKDVPLTGQFNVGNVIPAIITAKLFNIQNEKITKGIRNFKPLPDRLEFVGKIKGIRFYNDSLATNPMATIVAIEALGNDVETLITGGFDRGLDYSILGRVIFKSKIKNLILFPTTGEKIWNAVRNSNKYQKSSIKKFDVNNMKEAVRLAYKYTKSGKICLLSPASASFNLFRDYKDRGNQFKRWVLSGQAT